MYHDALEEKHGIEFFHLIMHLGSDSIQWAVLGHCDESCGKQFGLLCSLTQLSDVLEAFFVTSS